MKRNSIITLYIILGIIFFSFLLVFSEKKVYFSLLGKEYIELNINEQYKEDGYEAMYCNKYFKLFCKDISKNVQVIEYEKNGKLFINYNLIHKKNNKILTREIVFLDKESPRIEVLEDNIALCPNKTYESLLYKAYDNVDGDLTDKVKVEIKNDKIYYSVSDSSGNSKIIFKDIEFVDDEFPVISLKGGDKSYIYKGRDYIEKGFLASDNCDGDISNNVKVTSDLDINKAGEYTLNYTVSDSMGNKFSTSRNVIVYDDNSKIPKNGKVIYLTFDDGPGSYTEDILKVLDRYNVKATFFVTNQFSSYQNLIKTEYEKGHTIAVHTYSHNYKRIYSSVDNYLSDFNNMNQVIFEQTGEYSKIFRFPGGTSNTISRFNKGIMSQLNEKMKELGYYSFDWNVDSMDTSYKNPNDIANSVIKELPKHDNSIVLMHDIKKANIESVDMIISYGLENGYTFLPLDITSPIYQHTVNN